MTNMISFWRATLVVTIAIATLGAAVIFGQPRPTTQPGRAEAKGPARIAPSEDDLIIRSAPTEKELDRLAEQAAASVGKAAEDPEQTPPAKEQPEGQLKPPHRPAEPTPPTPAREEAAPSEPPAVSELPAEGEPSTEGPWPLIDPTQVEYSFSWAADTPYATAIEDFRRMTGLPLVGSPQDVTGTFSYMGTEKMTFRQALGNFNTRILMPKNYMLVLEEGYLRLVRVPEITRLVRYIFYSEEEFRAADLTDDEFCMVFYTPPSGSASKLIEDLRSTLPDYVRTQAMGESNRLYIIALKADITKFLDMVTKLAKMGPSPEPRELRVYRLKHIKASEAEGVIRTLVPMSTGERKMVMDPRTRRMVPARGERSLGLADVEAVDLSVDEKTNGLLVKATPEKHEQIQEILERIDVMPPDHSNPSVRVYKLQYAQATNLASTLQQVMQFDSVLKAQHQWYWPTEQINIVPDANANCLIVTATDQGHERMQALIEQFDQAGLEPQHRRFILQHARFDAVFSVLQPLYLQTRGPRGPGAGGAVNIATDPDGNAIVVIAGEEDMRRISETIALLDAPPAKEAVTNIVKLQHARPSMAANMLTQAWSGGPAAQRAKLQQGGVKFLGDDHSGNLVVVATAEEFNTEIKPFIETLDSGARFIQPVQKIYAPRHASAVEIANMLSQVFGTQYALPSGPSPIRVVPDTRTNTVLISAVEQVQAEIAALLERLDVPRGEHGLPVVLPCAHADVNELAQVLVQMFGGSGPAVAVQRGQPGRPPPIRRMTTAGVKIVPESATNSILVQADPETLELIKAFVADYDRRAAERGDFREIYQPRFLTAAELQEVLNTLLSGPVVRGKAISTDQELKLAVSGNQLVLKGPRAEVSEALALAEQLDTDQGSDRVEIFHFDLTHARAAEIAPRLEQLLGMMFPQEVRRVVRAAGGRPPQIRTSGARLAVVADGRANRLTIAAPARILLEAHRLISELDNEASGPQSQVFKVVKCTSPSVVAEAVRQAMATGVSAPRQAGQATTPSLCVAPSNGVVLLSGLSTDVALAEKMVLAMESASPCAEALPRKFGPFVQNDCDQIAELIQKLWGTPQAGAAGPAVSVVPYTVSNMVLVTAPAEILTQIAELIDMLEQPLAEGEVAVLGNISYVDLEHGSAEDIEWDLQLMIDDLFPKEEVTVYAVSDKRLMIVCRKSLLPQVQEIVSLHDVPKKVGPGIEILRPDVPLGQLAELLATYQSDELEIEFVRTADQFDESMIPEVTADPTSRPTEVFPCILPGGGQVAVMHAMVDKLLAGQNEQGAPTTQPAEQKVKIVINERDGTIRLFGPPEKVREYKDLITDLEEDLAELTEKEEIRVFRPRKVDVTIAAAILDQMFNEVSSGQAAQQQAMMRRLQQMQQQLRQQPGAAAGQPPAERGDERGKAAAEPAPAPEAPTKARIRVYPDPRTNTLIIRALATDFPAILELLAKIDTEASRTKTFRVFQLTKLDAQVVEEALTGLFGMGARGRAAARPQMPRIPARMRGGAQNLQLIQQLQQQMMELAGFGEEGAIRPGEDINIVSDSTTNTLIVMATPDALTLIEQIITELEAQPPALEVRTFELQYAAVPQVVDALQQFFAARPTAGARGGGGAAAGASSASVVGDERTGKVIVKASPAELEEAANLIKVMDVVSPEEGLVTLYPLEHGEAESMVAALGQLYEAARATEPIRFSADRSTNTVLVWAPRGKREEIARHIQQLDSVADETELTPRVFTLKYADASEVLAQLNQMMQQLLVSVGRMPGVKVDVFAASADPRTNSLVVVGGPLTFTLVEGLLSQLDVEVDTEMSTGRDTRIIKLQYASAAELANVMSQTQARAIRGMEPVTVVASEGANSLLVTSTQSEFERMQELVAKLDVPPEEGEGRPYRVLPLPSHIDGTQFARQVEQTWNRAEHSRARAERRQPRMIAVGSVPGSNAVIVAGSPSQFRDVEGMVNELLTVRPPGVRQVRTISVQNIDPNEVKRLVDEVTKPRQR